MKSPHGWIKTAGTGSAYCTKGGGYWIAKKSGQWILLQMSNQSLGREKINYGAFPTLTAAVEYYKNEVAA
jgi:hypothetical protein